MNLYSNISPIEIPIPAARQAAKRHYGVHPYFTRRPYNVVRDYILHYSKEGDRVLDPFGGSGVTAIEAFLENRIGIQNDINPLANFIAQGIANLHRGNLSDYMEALFELKDKCEDKLHKITKLSEGQVKNFRKTVHLPKNIALPRNSDAKQYHDLFTPRQLISLALLKDNIDSLPNAYARQGMLLAWSATLSKLNKTFLSAEGRAESRGGSSIFSIYRYKVAKDIVELPPWETFYERAKNIIEAKEEIDRSIELKKRSVGWSGKFIVHSKDIEDISNELSDSIDYIYTDPPYGGHIAYLDLSTLWNVWLGLSPDTKTREKELIVGGELKLSEDHYIERLGSSIKACTKMLRKNRWLSIVFQHWNISYFEAILSAAAESGAELKTAISQVGDPIWSMHKKKNLSVLAGELILTFHKSGKITKIKKDGKFDVRNTIKKILDNTKSDKVFGEHLFNRLIIEAWNKSAIQSLNISKAEFINILEEYGWNYDEGNHHWIKHSGRAGLLPYD